MYLYIVHMYNLAEISTKNAKVEIKKWNIPLKKVTDIQIQKNDKDNKNTKMTLYIQKENMIKYAIHCTNYRT